MKARTANATWKGDLPSGSGEVALGSGAYRDSYSFQSRFEDGGGTNPEELIAAAEAGCFSMALAHSLASAGFKPESVTTRAAVHLAKAGDGFEIPRIELEVEAKVPGIDEATFQEHAAKTKVGCPVSKALAGPEITLSARLV
ncbi:MAG: OsmC family protein [Rhodospirillales bacterium]|nr:OsmC family protein [Rhodospirillales bacterium]